jgi:hypothetical protein
MGVKNLKSVPGWFLKYCKNCLKFKCQGVDPDQDESAGSGPVTGLRS